MPYDLTVEQRNRYRETAIRSNFRKQRLLRDHCEESFSDHALLGSRFDPTLLMPQLPHNGLTCLSLFSGGGGLDLGFERAGFHHATAIEILEICGETLRVNRPAWRIQSGSELGDVRSAAFKSYLGIDIVHGGPPCQPFSIAGKQEGASDPRNMWPDFIRCVLESKPRAFIAENVPGILERKFESFVQQNIVAPLSSRYQIFRIKLAAHEFGVPQARRRVFFVGFASAKDAARWQPPIPTHGNTESPMGLLSRLNTARLSLGLPDIGFDCVAPTLRSGFTGPRNTTGILNSKAALIIWNQLQIWPNGVQKTRSLAHTYRPENGHFRLAVEDCALLQGFPSDWKFSGAVYQVLGQIGNSVCPPVSYAVAKRVAAALGAA